MQIFIATAYSHDNGYALLHKPLVALDDSGLQQRSCQIFELLDYLKSGDFSTDEEISRAAKELREKGQTALESTKIVDAGLQRLLKPRKR